MSTVYISEYASSHSDTNGVIQIGEEPAIAEQSVAITGGSVQSNPFNSATNFVRVHTDSVCSILFGTNPTAVVTAKRMAANTTEYFGTQGGQMLAVISNS